ncbi:uncharacterized protein VICG_00440 [Vittaforma corneae ATCC 50505]|uniref:RuvB-like helicase n=1 Tax=Vittaforma corneae (strain ATCC 50505) TaxID=993615 RepID=L2GPU4_VITCO|nr:uncharacterized protein VICG_00440 [Vittaforma corneae ATCC 50505]ELA42342.1 hypothetical protein VICG_00440 [Vittaforma corneae ATCC 50505]
MHGLLNVLSSEETGHECLRYLTTGRASIYLPLLKRILESDQGSVVTVFGPRGSGRHTFICKGVHERRTMSCIVDAEEIRDDGKLSVQKLHKLIRSVTAVTIKEYLKIVEGEVISMSNGKIHLKTRDMESVFGIGVRIRKELERERVCVGDIIKIYKESCFVVRQGRLSERNPSLAFDLLPKIQLPEGECIKTETVHTTLTLNELDTLNFKENGEEYLYTDVYINGYIRNEVDKKVAKLLKEGKAGLERGVLVIDGCEALSEDEIKCIISVCSGMLHPTVFLVFDQEDSRQVAGEISLRFYKYTASETGDILRNYCASNDVEIEDGAVEKLCEIADSKGLCAAIRILKASVSMKSVAATTVSRIFSVFDE